MEESTAVLTKTTSAVHADAAPLSATLDESEETEKPLNDNLPPPSTKSASVSTKDGAHETGVGSNAKIDKREANNSFEKPNDVVKSPAPVPSSTGLGDVDYARWEFEPPLANIRRLLKPILSKGTNISKGAGLDSVTALSRAAGMFILYVNNCATDIAREGKRSTIAAKDVMAALKELDLQEFIPELEQFMVEHKKYEKNKKDEKDRTKKLHDGPGNKKGVRGADGKWVAPATDVEVKNERDETDDENNEDTLELDVIDHLKAKRDLDHDNETDGSAIKRRKLEAEDDSDL